MFNGASPFNKPIGSWVLSIVTGMEFVFQLAAPSFNQPLETGTSHQLASWEICFIPPLHSIKIWRCGMWDVSSVCSAVQRFDHPTSFIQDLSS
mmetsp:Transcript_10806/g.17904  ORF Transcript_10806/g.17904 Transcript_10806/m.17904 type:complete len:93 (+) Transcript_10806:21-299(+)